MRKLDTIFVHCSATPHSRSHNAADIKRWHMAQGWTDNGYHFVILRNGTVEMGRPLTIMGAHTKGHNRTSIGICLIGGLGPNNLPSTGFTKAQFAALRRLIKTLREEYLIKSDRILGHYQVAKKACPCFDVPEWYHHDRILPSNY